MNIALTPHPEIERYLAANPVRNLFPLYVCAQRPEARSPACVESGRIRGAVVTGRAFGIAPAGAAWLAADSEAVAEALLASVAPEGRLGGLQLPWELAPAARVCAGFQVSRDLYLTRAAGPVVGVPAPHGTLVSIDTASLAQLNVPPEVSASIGNLATLPPGAPFWGLSVDGRLVAICETMVRYGSNVTIQQVFTAPDARRHHHARSMLTRLLAHPSLAGTTLTWLVEERNSPSVALARGLGFVDSAPFGCLERA